MPIPKPTESDSGLVRHSVQLFERECTQERDRECVSE